MLDRPSCQCGYVSVNPEADSSAVCGGCGRPLGSGDTRDLPPPVAPSDNSLSVIPPEFEPTADPREHVVTVRRKQPPTPPPDVPGYEILGELGRGGMGVVYKAREVALNRVVALKMILAGAHASDAERARFRREAEAVAALHHAGIVQIYHVGEYASQPFLVLEYVDGGNLADRIGGGNLLSVREAAVVVGQLAEAMQYAHDQGVIHRDLKPANILLTRGEVKKEGGSESSLTGAKAGSGTTTLFKISDFGLAKKLDDTVAVGGGTRSGAVMGTPSYISPEQAAGKSNHVTARSDVYSLGAILYEILTDRPPFKADTPLETVLQVINDDPVPPSKLRPKLPRDLETVCLKCLQKDPAKRYATAAELAADLGRFLRGEPILARPVSAVTRGWKWVRRHPALAAFATTAVAAMLAVVGVLVVSNTKLAEANHQKELEAETAREQSRIATEQKEMADRLADEREKALKELAAEGERNRRSLYALQLSQVAGIVARDPYAALRLLDDPVKCPRDLRDFAWRYLRRLCSRAESVQTAHRRPLRACSVSPDGLLVVSADTSGQVLVWHPQTRVVYAKLTDNTSPITAVAFSPDGSAVSGIAADGMLFVWRITPALRETVALSARLLPDAQTEINRLLPGASSSLAQMVSPAVVFSAFGRTGRCVAFSGDGRYLAAGGADRERSPGQLDGVARVWEFASLLPPLDAPREAVLGVTSPFAEWCKNHPSGVEPVKVVTNHLQPVCSIALSSDGQLLATGSEDRGVILSEMGSSKREELRLHGGAVNALAFNPDGSTLATADNDEYPVVVLWDVTKRRVTEKRKLIGHGGRVYGLAFSSDGRSLATAADESDRTVRVWDVESGNETARLYGHRDGVRAVGWLPDRHSLVSASDDGTARVWHTTLRTNDALALFGDEPAMVLAAAVSESGSTLVTADARGRVRFWAVDKLFDERQSQAELPVYLIPSKPTDSGEWQVNGMSVSADGQRVAVASSDGVQVWDLANGRRVFGAAVLTVPPKLVAADTAVNAVQFTPDGTRLIALTADGLKAWDSSTLRDITPAAWAEIHPPQFGGTLAVSADSKVVAVSAVGANREPLLALADQQGVWFHPEPAPVTTLDFDPESNQLAVGLFRSPGRIVKLVRTGDEWRLDVICDTAAPLSALWFSRGGRTLLGVRGNRELVLLDPATGVERTVLSGHADRIVGAGFTTRDGQLITVGRDGVVKRWNGESTARPMLWEWWPRPGNNSSVPFAPRGGR